eukprot:jgi/Tetstr1/461330/TSEL_006456.t1
MASKAKNMTLLFESAYAQALECLRIYDTLEERKKAAPTARKFELLTRGGGQSGPGAELPQRNARAKRPRGSQWRSVQRCGDGSSGGLSLGALRLGGSNVEAGGVATQEEIAECTSSGGSTCQGVNVDAKDGMRLAEVLRRRQRGVLLGVETGGDPDFADTPERQAIRSSVDRSKPDAQCLVCIVIEVTEHGLSDLRPMLES